MKVVLATKNRYKIKEIKNILSNGSLNILTLLDFPDIPDIDEKGNTLEENAAIKAREVAKRTGLVTIADDSGLEVPGLGGKPGVRSARFAGEKVDFDANNKKLLKLMERLPEGKRAACFRCVVAIAMPCGSVETVEGRYEGEIAFRPRGKNGFGYDPVFIDPATGKTFAEMSFQEKNSISHRAKAILKAADVLSKRDRLSSSFEGKVLKKIVLKGEEIG